MPFGTIDGQWQDILYPETQEQTADVNWLETGTEWMAELQGGPLNDMINGPKKVYPDTGLPLESGEATFNVPMRDAMRRIPPGEADREGRSQELPLDGLEKQLHETSDVQWSAYKAYRDLLNDPESTPKQREDAKRKFEDLHGEVQGILKDMKEMKPDKNYLSR